MKIFDSVYYYHFRAYNMIATNHDGHKVYEDGHSNENVKKLTAYF